MFNAKTFLLFEKGTGQLAREIEEWLNSEESRLKREGKEIKSHSVAMSRYAGSHEAIVTIQVEETILQPQ